MPAHNAESMIGECLDALMSTGFAPSMITVVDDGSQDRTAEIAVSRGVNLLRNETAQRPSQARNRGAAVAGGEIILFVDSDVCVHSDIWEQLKTHLGDPSISGVIGAYDNAPRSSSMVGRYRNLLHAYTHQKGAGDVPTFWSGLGVLRRDVFDQAGGFRSEWENIEDVELGLRVTANGGRILLDPKIKGKHLKDWSLGSMIKTDLLGRAVPWTRLLKSGRLQMGVLATSLDKRISAASIALGGLSLLAGFFFPKVLMLFSICAIVFVAANMSLFRFLMHSNGLMFTLCAALLHVVHHVSGLLGYAKVMVLERNGGSANGDMFDNRE